MKDLSKLAQSHTPTYLPACMKAFVEHAAVHPELNFLDDQTGLFYFPRMLQSYAERTTKNTILLTRDRSKTFVLGDSGGFQIASGNKNWKLDYHDRSAVDPLIDDILQWYGQNVDAGLILDIPTLTLANKSQPSIQTFHDCVNVTEANVKRMMQVADGFPLYNVIQFNSDRAKIDAWYAQLTPYQLHGWALGGNATMLEIVYVLLKLHRDGLLKPPSDKVHVLGCGKIDALYLLRVINEYLSITITTDSATSSHQVRFGTLYSKPDVITLTKPRACAYPASKSSTINWNQYQNHTMQAMFRAGLLDDFRSPVLANKTVADISKTDGYTEQLARLHNKWCYVYANNGIPRVLGLPPRNRSHFHQTHGMKLVNAEIAIRSIFESQHPFSELNNWRHILKGVKK